MNRKKYLRRTLIFVGLIAVVFGAAFAATSGAVQSANEFITAVRANDLDSARNVICDGLRASFTKTALQEFADQLKDLTALPSWLSRRVHFGAQGEAEIAADVATNNGESKRLRVALKRENGLWCIHKFDASGHGTISDGLPEFPSAETAGRLAMKSTQALAHYINTGNPESLFQLGSADFRKHTPESMKQLFQSWFDRKLVFTIPDDARLDFTAPIGISPDGILSLNGYLPLGSHNFKFTYRYKNEIGLWKLDALSAELEQVKQVAGGNAVTSASHRALTERAEEFIKLIGEYAPGDAANQFLFARSYLRYSSRAMFDRHLLSEELARVSTRRIYRIVGEFSKPEFVELEDDLNGKFLAVKLVAETWTKADTTISKEQTAYYVLYSLESSGDSNSSKPIEGFIRRPASETVGESEMLKRLLRDVRSEHEYSNSFSLCERLSASSLVSLELRTKNSGQAELLAYRVHERADNSHFYLEDAILLVPTSDAWRLVRVARNSTIRWSRYAVLDAPQVGVQEYGHAPSVEELGRFVQDSGWMVRDLKSVERISEICPGMNGAVVNARRSVAFRSPPFSVSSEHRYSSDTAQQNPKNHEYTLGPVIQVVIRNI